jgi:adenosine deaminase
VNVIHHMHDLGLTITLATDAPALFATDIGEAYRRVCLGTHLSVAEARALTLNAVQAAWLDEASRAQLHRAFEDDIEALTRTLSAS